jgi:hypothetical protein
MKKRKTNRTANGLFLTSMEMFVVGLMLPDEMYKFVE